MSFEFASKTVEKSIAQILNMVGVDRIHNSVLQVLVEVSQEYMCLLVRKLLETSNLGNRSRPASIDFLMVLEFLDIECESFQEFIKSVRGDFKFPRIEPACFPISEINANQQSE
jgi:hypothetical protein